MHVGDLSNGYAECTLTVEPAVQNSYATLHGGAVSTLVDVLGTLALIGADHTRAGVSLEMNVSFLAAAKAGDELVVTGRVLKAGRSIGFTEVEIRRKSDDRLIATGRHTKAL
jgi:acyl-coenzyme A thioesterase 13